MEFTADTLPTCACDHDFWDGINFHFPRCPKYQPVQDFDCMFRGLTILLGARRMHRLTTRDGKLVCMFHGENCLRTK